MWGVASLGDCSILGNGLGAEGFLGCILSLFFPKSLICGQVSCAAVALTDLLRVHRNFLFSLVSGVGSWAAVFLPVLLGVELLT